MQTDEGYVGLVKLKDYYKFITDERGDLVDQIFESNVRGFQQRTPVNTQIRASLRSTGQANFWLLNNGITVIASKAQNAGNKRLNLEDPQIVNGLQTSREIFDYFCEEKPLAEERSVLLRVIETGNEVVRDAVIKATNSQNKMLAACLRATDPIHHQIEDLFKALSNIYYDRRKGFYKDKGKPIESIVSVTELVQAVVSVYLQRPDDARGRPGDYIKEDAQYESIFGQDKLPLSLYLTCITLMRRVEDYLDAAPMDKGDKRNVKFYTAFYLACRLTQELKPSADRLLAIKVPEIEEGVLRDCHSRVWKRYEELGKTDTLARGPELLKKLKADIRRRFKAKKP